MGDARSIAKSLSEKYSRNFMTLAMRAGTVLDGICEIRLGE